MVSRKEGRLARTNTMRRWDFPSQMEMLSVLVA